MHNAVESFQPIFLGDASEAAEHVLTLASRSARPSKTRRTSDTA
jgi:hypothetical protein